MEYKRLNKAISETGYCSRRAADALISGSRVKVNGEVADLGTKVTVKDEIIVDGEVIVKKVKDVYLVFNKPVGITCTTELHVKSNIISFIDYPERIFPIGRLDKPSEGLIFMTNNGDIVNKILRAGNNHEKEYVVSVDKKISSHFLKKMAAGVPVLGTLTKKCTLRKLDDFTFDITLTQGLNRQIRRMCQHLGYQVKSLKRVRIMHIGLGNLKTGKYRHFTEMELGELLLLLENSSKTMPMP